MIILAGKPGAGKGTQLDFLKQRQGYTGVSVGEALREAAQHDPEIAAIQKAGKLVDTDTAGKVVEAAIEKAGTRKIILDGFPRNAEQTAWLKRYLENVHDKIVVVVLDVHDDEIHRRLALRGRTDDHPDTIRDRLTLYEKETLPQLQGLGGLYELIHIDGSGEKEAVYKRLILALKKVNV